MPGRTLHEKTTKKRVGANKTKQNIQSALDELKAENERLTAKLEEAVRERRVMEETLMDLGADVDIAVGRIRLYEDVQNQNRILSALQEATLAVMRQLSLPDALSTILAQAAQLIGTSHGYIYLLQPDASLVLTTGIGVYPKYVGVQLRMDEGLAGRVWRDGKPLLINDYQHWDGRSKQFQDTHFEAVIGAPIMNGDRVGGILGLSHLEPDKGFTEGDLELLVRFCQLASIAINNASLYTQARRELAEHQQAEEALLAMKDQYRQLVEQLPLVVYQDHPDEIGTNFYISPQVKDLLGYLPEDFKKDPNLWKSIIHPDDYDQALATIPNVIKNGRNVEDYRMVTEKGDVIWIRDTAVVIRDEAGKIKFIQGFLEDVTERKLATESIRKSEQRLQAFFNQSLDGFFFCDFDMPAEWKYAPNREDVLDYIISSKKFTDVNNAMLKQYGYSREKFLSLTTNDIFAHDLEQGRNLRRELFDNGFVHAETFERTSDGTPVWFEGDYVCLYDSKERITGFFGIQRNITDRKKAETSLRESEKNLEEAQRIAHVGSWTWVAATDTTYWSKELCAILEVDPDKPTPSVADQDKLYTPESMQRMRAAISRTMETGAPYEVELEGFRKDGSRRWLLSRGERWYNDKNELIGLRGTALEITERKLNEQALRESEERYRTLFDGMLDGIYRSTHDGRFVDVNPAMVQMFGYSSREEMMAIDIKKELYFAPEERGSHILDTGQQETEVYRMRRKDGTEIWVEDHGYYVHDDKGRILYHEGILRDVTERVRAENALKRSEAFTKSIVDNEPECVKIVTHGGILQYMNPAGLAMIEVDDLKSVVGKSVYALVDKKDRDAFQELTEKVLRGEQGTLQFEIIGLKGTRRLLDTHAVPLYDEQGNVTSLLGLTRDITERKLAEDALRAAEEKYRSIFENAIEGIYQSLPAGRFLTVNPAFAAMMGYASPREMIDAITDIAGQLYIDRARRNDFVRLLEEEGSVTGFEYQMRRKDGQLVWVSENSRVVRGAEGQILYYEGILEDITVRKLNEQQLDNHLRQLNALHVIDNAINSNFDLRMTLEVLLREVLAQLKVDAASVLLFNKDTHTLNYTAGRGFLSKATQHTKLSAGEGFAGRVIVERKTIHIPNLAKTDSRLSAALSIAGENFTAYVGSPLIAKGQIVGVLEIFQRSPLNPTQDWFDFLGMITDQAAIAIDNAQLFENLQRSNFELTLAYDATIEGWSRALDLRDRETEGHTQRVTNLTMKLAQRMGVPDADILHIRRGALLHDIGKMGIPDSILHKPDKLTPEEWLIMRQHPTYAYAMLSPINYLKPALDIPRYHHEHWDGTGYPEALRGEQIPIAARIFAVVDVWDALTSDRAYREAWSKEKAAEYVRNESGRHFDPRVVDIFLSMIAEDEHF